MESPDHPPQNNRILERALGWIALMLLAFAVAFSWQTWEREKAEQIDELNGIVETGELAVDAYFRQLDIGLKVLSRELAIDGERIDLARAYARVREFSALHTELSNMSLIREDGQILFIASAPPGSGLPNIATRPGFQAFRDELQAAPNLVVGRPLTTLIDQKWMVPVRFGVKDQTGRLRFFISGHLPVDMLKSFWHQPPLGGKAIISLGRDDSFNVSRFPLPASLDPNTFFGKPRNTEFQQYLRQHAYPASGVMERFSTISNTNMLTSFRRLGHFPLTLTVSVEMSEVWRAWWAVVRAPYFLLALLLLGALMVYRLTLRRQQAWSREQQRIGAALRQSEERLQLAAANSNTGLWDWNLRNDEVYFSPIWKRQLGYAAKELDNHFSVWAERLHPDDRDATLARMRRSAAAPWPEYECEFRLRHKDGSWRWILARAAVHFDSAGQPMRMLGSHLDITEKRQAQEMQQALHRISEAAHAAADLDHLFRDIHAIVGALLPAENFYVALHDESRGELNFPYFVDEHDREMPPRQLGDGLTETVLRSGEALLISQGQGGLGATEDGRWQHIIGTDCIDWLGVPLISNQRTIGVLAVQSYSGQLRYTERDRQLLAFVSGHVAAAIARKQAEAALLSSEQRYRSVVTTLAEGILVRDRNGLLVDCNPSAERIIGESLAQMKGRGTFTAGWEICREDGSPVDYAESVTQMALRSGKPQSNVIMGFRKPNGTQMWLSMNAQPLFEPGSSEISGVVTTFSDVTDLRLANDMRTAKEAAELANRTKSVFLASMSHELRTPLNSILGFAQLLGFDPALKSSAGVQAKVRHILTAGQHLLALVDGVLDLSRIEAGTIQLAIEPVDMAPLVDECVILTRPQADGRSIRVLRRNSDVSGWIRGDRTRLRQVLVNILSNAIKYNRVGGEVHIELTQAGDFLDIAVRDTGSGLSREQQARLFEPFNRLGAEASVIEGTGIGLVIVKQLVESMQGKISVDSAPGEGATFTLRFARSAPGIASPDIAAAPTRVPLLVPASRRFQVLYVEDNPANIALVRETLALNPAIDLAIENEGTAGLASAMAMKPDLIMLDINLPGMDGFSIMQRLRADPSVADIACIALSANAMAGDAERARRAGFRDYITKPFDVASLLARVEELLPQD